MAGSLTDLRLAEIKTSGAQASRHFQVWRRCSRRAAAVLCAFGGLGILIASAALWHHFHHGEHHGHAHKLVRQRHHLPTWMHFPSPVNIRQKRLRGRKLKMSLHLHLPHLPHMPHLPQGIKQLHKKEKQEHIHAELPCESEHHHPHHSHEHHSHHHHEHSLVEELVAYPRVFVAEVVAVVFLSTLFETWEHWVRHRLAHQGRTSELRILDCLFKEVTCLGFIGLVLYLLHRFSLADLLASKIFLPQELEEENPLFETFELVHMMIFMLLIVLLFQAAALLPISHAIVENWREYERIRAWGQSASCMETQFVQAGYLRRVTCPDSPRGIELQYVRPFTYGDSWKERWTLRKDPVVKIIMWRALRHEFLCDNKEETPTHRSNHGHGHGHDHHGKHGKHHHQHKPHINPALFSYEGYLRGLLSNTVVALVEVDMTTWGVTLMALIPLMYSCICFSCSIEFLQCMIAWVLVAGAAMLAMCLEEDIHKLTPGVPEDARLILRLFSGTSIHDFQRSSGPDRADPGHDSYHGAPGLGGVSCEEDYTKFTKAEKHSEDEVIMSCESYRRLFHVVAFWQAICVTSLVVSFLSHPFARTSSVVLHLLAWAEWPVMLFCVWPMLVQRLTIRYSVDETRDYGLIRSVAIHSKEALLRHHIRLAQVMGFYKRGLEANENWTQLPAAATSASVAKPQAKSGRRPSVTMGRQRSWKAAFTKVDADKNFRHGQHVFHGLSDDQQEEVLELFQIMDNDNDESVSMDEIAGKFRSMGFKEDAEMAARSVFRLVQHNSSQFFATRFLNDQGSVPTLTCDKFCAMIALTTTNRLEAELEEDILSIFRLVDKASPEVVTVFELTEWMRGIKNSLTEGDVATVLHKHFGEAKPTLMRWEFLEWFEALAGGEDDEEHHH